MNIGRIIVCVLALCLGGFAVGWFILPPAKPPQPGDTSGVLQHRFALTAADMKLDRERPSLAIVGDKVLLAWSSQTSDQEYTLFLARSTDRGTTFGAPTAFRKFEVLHFKSRMHGQEILRPSPVLPRLSAAGDRITLGWTDPGAPRLGDRTLSFLVADSHDGGAVFSEPTCISGEAARKPNFTGLCAAGDGSTAAVWLDAQQPHLGLVGCPNKSPVQALVSAGPEGGKGICPCCDLDVARTPAGITLVAFRNSVEGHRDIYVARSGTGGAFEPPVPVAADHWTFNGCPHDGPALALAGDRVHVAWTSGHTGQPRVYVAQAPITELAFQPRPVSTCACSANREQGHPRIAAVGQTVYVVWDEALAPTSAGSTPEPHHGAPSTAAGRAIMYARSDDGGLTFGARRPVATTAGAFQTRPVLEVDGSGCVHVAWSELGENGKSVGYARLPQPNQASTGAAAHDECR